MCRRSACGNGGTGKIPENDRFRPNGLTKQHLGRPAAPTKLTEPLTVCVPATTQPGDFQCDYSFSADYHQKSSRKMPGHW
jgi:hypothetical protein